MSFRMPISRMIMALFFSFWISEGVHAGKYSSLREAILGLEQVKIDGRNYYEVDPITKKYNYSTRLFARHVRSILLTTTAIYGSTLTIGIRNWNWGSSRFRFHNEGWFGKNTGSGGVDKLGHAFSGAILADLFTDRIRMAADDPRGAAITGSLLSLGLMTGVEIFDGFSNDHGFSYEDMAIDIAGIVFSYFRNSVPGMRELIDFRQEYFPKGYEKGFHPLLGYENKRYLMALKLSGMDALHDSPARFLELHAGYYAQGFSDAARLRGVPKKRTLYIGVGINLNALFMGDYERDEHPLKWGARFALEHFQIPFTSVGTSNEFYKRY